MKLIATLLIAASLGAIYTPFDMMPFQGAAHAQANPEQDLQTALSLYQQGELDQSLKVYDRLVRQNPSYKDGVVYYGRGLVYAAKDMLSEAIADFNAAIQLNPKSGYYYYDRGSVYLKQDKDALALKDFDQALLLSPDKLGQQPYAYNDRGLTHLRLNQ